MWSRPILNPYEKWVYGCFVQLSRDRRQSYSGPLTITTTEVYNYCKALDILEDVHHLLPLIQAIDDVWLDCVTEKQKREAKNPPKKP